MEFHVVCFSSFYLVLSLFISCRVYLCVFVQIQWMAAPQTVMGMESVWLDTVTALLDFWVQTVPKVSNINKLVDRFYNRRSVFFLCLSSFCQSQISLSLPIQKFIHSGIWSQVTWYSRILHSIILDVHLYRTNVFLKVSFDEANADIFRAGFQICYVQNCWASLWYALQWSLIHKMYHSFKMTLMLLKPDECQNTWKCTCIMSHDHN